MTEKKTAAKDRRQTEEEKIDETIEDSFPASDPPAFTGVTSGSPEDHKTPSKPRKEDGKSGDKE